MRKLFLIALLLMGFLAPVFAQTVESSDTTLNDRKAPRLRIALQAGGGYRLARVATDQDRVLIDHMKKLKWGLSYGADVTYYFIDSFGAGIKFSNFHTGHSEYITASFENGTTRSGPLSDNIDIFFAGPVAAYRVLSASGRNAFIASYSIGYLGYVNKGALIDSYKIKGGSVGFVAEIGYDIGITDNLSIGANLSWISGSLGSFDITDEAGKTTRRQLKYNEMESLSHLSLTLGFRLNLL